jgi:hypothetical protein
MYGLTRATTTLLAAGVAGFLVWLATQFDSTTDGEYWAIAGLIAAAGCVMAISQLLGGWTKWGWPRLSAAVLLLAFVPVAIASLWVIVAGEPGNTWLHDHVRSWSADAGIGGLVTDLTRFVPVLAFGTGLVFGFSFDTSGPPVARETVVEEVPGERPVPVENRPVPVEERVVADEPVAAEREAVDSDDTVVTRDRDGVETTVAPTPEPPPRPVDRR